MRVFRYNELTGSVTPTKKILNSAGVKVGIWLQYYKDKKWEWVGDTDKDPEILITGLTEDFTIKSNYQFSSEQPNNNPIRRVKRAYPQTKIWRFGKVKVYDFVGGEYNTADGHLYVLVGLSYKNKLPPTSVGGAAEFA